MARTDVFNFTINPRVWTLWQELGREVASHDKAAHQLLDLNTFGVLCGLVKADPVSGIVLQERIMSGCEIGAWFSRSRKWTRDRLKVLAHYGLIKVITGPYVHDQKKRLTNKVIVNPILLKILLKDATPQQRVSAAKYFAGMGVQRSGSLCDMQGFESSVKFGEEEPPLKTGQPGEFEEIKVGTLFGEATVKSKTISDADRKKQERKEHRDRLDRWIHACNRVWQRGMIEAGRMSRDKRYDAPWAGQRLQVAPANKPMRKNLEDLFSQFGGKTTGLAWIYYVMQKPVINSKTNKPDFRPSLGHIQNASIDKRTNHFATHFANILADPEFIKRSEDDDMLKWLSDYFGDLKNYATASSSSALGQSETAPPPPTEGERIAAQSDDWSKPPFALFNQAVAMSGGGK